MVPSDRSLSELPKYRLALALLVFAMFAVVTLPPMIGFPKLISGLAGLYLYIILIVVTYRRLRDAALSGNWIAPMILVFQFGPEWNDLYLSSLINLLPVAAGWIVPANWGGNPKTPEAHA